MIDTLQFSRRRDVCTKLNMRSKQSDPWVLIAWVSCLFLAPPQTPSKQPPISNLLVPRPVQGWKKHLTTEKATPQIAPQGGLLSFPIARRIVWPFHCFHFFKLLFFDTCRPLSKKRFERKRLYSTCVTKENQRQVDWSNFRYQHVPDYWFRWMRHDWFDWYVFRFFFGFFSVHSSHFDKGVCHVFGVALFSLVVHHV